MELKQDLRRTLPTNWIVTQLNNISEVILGQSPPSSTYNRDKKGLPFYQGKLEFGDIYPTPRIWCTSPIKIAEKGDVLISVRAPVGPTNINPGKSCIGRGLAAIHPLGSISSLFILYLLRANEDIIARKSTGTVFGAITGDKLRALEIPVPPIQEQKRIVTKLEELLTNLHAGTDYLKKTQIALKQYRQSVLKYAFEGKLTAEWREKNPNKVTAVDALFRNINKKTEKPNNDQIKPKETGPYKLPENWFWLDVKAITEKIQYGTSEKAFQDILNGIPVIRMGNIQEGKIIFENLKYFPADWKLKDEFLLHEGDILFNRTNSAELVGKSAVFENHYPKSVFASYLIRVTTHEEYHPKLLSWFINSFYGRLYISSVVSQQVGQANVNGTKLSSMPVPVMSKDEQLELINLIERNISLIAVNEKAVSDGLARSNLLRQGLLRKAFEGKLVSQNPNDEPVSTLLKINRGERIFSDVETNHNKIVKNKSNPKT